MSHLNLQSYINKLNVFFITLLFCICILTMTTKNHEIMENAKNCGYSLLGNIKSSVFKKKIILYFLQFTVMI